MVFGDFAGGAAALLVVERLMAANYSQAAETGADVFAIDVMTKAGLPTAPFAEFFVKIAELTGEVDEHGHPVDPSLMSHLASHPDSLERAESARQANQFVEGDYTPVLSKAEWADLNAICDGKPERDAEE